MKPINWSRYDLLTAQAKAKGPDWQVWPEKKQAAWELELARQDTPETKRLQEILADTTRTECPLCQLSREVGEGKRRDGSAAS